MKPSDVELRGVPPLVATFDRTEHEMLAALLIIACRHHGDAWQPVTFEMVNTVADPVREVLKRTPVGAKPDLTYEQLVMHTMFTLNLVRPSYATEHRPLWFEHSTINGKDAYAFTAAGIERLAKWVKS